MSDLAARLKARGLTLPGEASAAAASNAGFVALKAAALPELSRAAVSQVPLSALKAASVPAPLRMSSSETKDLFTPLANQGSKALRKEKERQLEGEDSLLEHVQRTLRKWVQECLARQEKREKLLEKGLLKCRVQAKWSEGLDKKLKGLTDRYGARLSADGEKENAKRVTWLPTTEKWLVGFNAASFETFAAAHPEVIDPPTSQVRAFLEDLSVRNPGALATASASESGFGELLEGRFGPMRKQSLARAQAFAAANSKKGTKRKAGAEAGEDPRKVVIETREDVAWAAGTLAPMGLKPETGEPLVSLRADVVSPILVGLKAFDKMPEFMRLLKDTQVGKIVSGYRHHTNPEVAKAAKELVSAWKAACQKK